jgi:hypothetical protein
MAQALAHLRQQLKAKLRGIAGGSAEEDIKQASSSHNHAAMALQYRAVQKLLAGAGIDSLSCAIAHTLDTFSAKFDLIDPPMDPGLLEQDDDYARYQVRLCSPSLLPFFKLQTPVFMYRSPF